MKLLKEEVLNYQTGGWEYRYRRLFPNPFSLSSSGRVLRFPGEPLPVGAVLLDVNRELREREDLEHEPA